MTMKQPWHRCEDEPREDYALFGAFLTAPTDRISEFWKALPETGRPSLSTLYARAADWRWIARRAALDHHMSAIRDEATAEAVREHGRVHASAWALAMDWALESILHARARGEILAPKDALAFLSKAFDAQRLMAGESTVNLGIDLARASLPLENLDKIAALLGESSEDE